MMKTEIHHCNKERRCIYYARCFEAWDSPVPSSILGTMWLSSILNEDKYPYDKFKDEAVEFYKEFYDIEINKEELTK